MVELVEFGGHCNLAGIAITIVKGGINSEKCEMVCRVLEFGVAL